MGGAKSSVVMWSGGEGGLERSKKREWQSSMVGGGELALSLAVTTKLKHH